MDLFTLGGCLWVVWFAVCFACLFDGVYLGLVCEEVKLL